jgi:predicted ATPase
MHLKGVRIQSDLFPTREHYPFRLDVLQRTEGLEFDAPVAFFVGENGCGKSTLLEAIALACGIHIWRGDQRARYSYNPHEGQLYRYVQREWADGGVNGSYFSSQTFQGFSRIVDEWASSDPDVLGYFGGRSLLTQSHGQSLMAFFHSRFSRVGLYLLDEPPPGSLEIGGEGGPRPVHHRDTFTDPALLSRSRDLQFRSNTDPADRLPGHGALPRLQGVHKGPRIANGATAYRQPITSGESLLWRIPRELQDCDFIMAIWSQSRDHIAIELYAPCITNCLYHEKIEQSLGPDGMVACFLLLYIDVYLKRSR